MKLPAIPLAFVVFAICTACASRAAPTVFSGADILALAAELAGPAYEGRLIGSDGSRKASERLTALLRDAGLKVDFLEFPDRVSVHVLEPFMGIVTEKGDKIAFEYRRDYREVVRGGWEGGSAEGPLHVITGGDGPFAHGSILLVAAGLYDPARLVPFAEAGAAGVIIELPEGTPDIRHLWAGREDGNLVEPRTGMIVLAVSGEAFARIKAAGGGSRIRMTSPVRFKDAIGRNVVASWNGDGGGFTPRLLFMAHYDHVGTDQDGSRFPGALDNASGTAMVVGLARAFSGSDIKADAAFVFTDGEETGLSGSRALAASRPFPIEGTTVINIDMVGSKADLALAVYSTGDAPGIALAGKIVALLRKAGFKAESQYPVPNVDHAAMTRAGARAITICEYDTENYHTKRDLPEGLDQGELGRMAGALFEYGETEVTR